MNKQNAIVGVQGNYQYYGELPVASPVQNKKNNGPLCWLVVVLIVAVAVVVLLAFFGVVDLGISAFGNGNEEVPITLAPTSAPTLPTTSPTLAPTSAPTPPTIAPTFAPTTSPTLAPTSAPTPPTIAPTLAPTFDGELVCDPVVGNEECSVAPLGEEIRCVSDGYIGLMFLACPKQSHFDAFLNAAQRWTQIITSSFNSVGLGFTLDTTACGTENSFIFTSDTVFTSLLIIAEIVPIDGVGNILGSAGPCLVDGLNLPVLGVMSFDDADIDSLSASDLQDVILHEMAHVLGIGTLWLGNDVLDDPFFPSNDIADFNANANPQYTGTQGILAYETLTEENEVSVPVEDFSSESRDPITGRGSVDGHWDIDFLVNELMVFALQSGVDHPLSVLSVRSLIDLGYQVDDNFADDFSLVSKKESNLRGGDEPMIYLNHDILFAWNLTAIKEDKEKRIISPFDTEFLLYRNPHVMKKPTH